MTRLGAFAAATESNLQSLQSPVSLRQQSFEKFLNFIRLEVRGESEW